MPLRVGGAAPALVGLIDLLGLVAREPLEDAARVDAAMYRLVVLAVDDVGVDGVQAPEESLALRGLRLGREADGLA